MLPFCWIMVMRMPSNRLSSDIMHLVSKINIRYKKCKEAISQIFKLSNILSPKTKKSKNIEVTVSTWGWPFLVAGKRWLNWVLCSICKTGASYCWDLWPFDLTVRYLWTIWSSVALFFVVSVHRGCLTWGGWDFFGVLRVLVSLLGCCWLVSGLFGRWLFSIRFLLSCSP